VAISTPSSKTQIVIASEAWQSQYHQSTHHRHCENGEAVCGNLIPPSTMSLYNSNNPPSSVLIVYKKGVPPLKPKGISFSQKEIPKRKT